MRIDVITLFPDMILGASRWGVSGRALERGIWSLQCWNPRDFATDNYRTIDDRPYGGGPGMVMMAEPLERALAAIREAHAAAGLPELPLVYLSPQGERWDHAATLEMAKSPGAILLAGRYEGVDERFISRHVDREISIGDYVMSGGELGALVIADCVVRQLPGVLNDDASAVEDSFADGLLDCPHYTRPEWLGTDRVPEVLLSGDHAAIRRWRLMQSLGRTWLRRPELLEPARLGRELSKEEIRLLEEFKRQHAS